MSAWEWPEADQVELEEITRYFKRQRGLPFASIELLLGWLTGALAELQRLSTDNARLREEGQTFCAAAIRDGNERARLTAELERREAEIAHYVNNKRAIHGWPATPPTPAPCRHDVRTAEREEWLAGLGYEATPVPVASEIETYSTFEPREVVDDWIAPVREPTPAPAEREWIQYDSAGYPVRVRTTDPAMAPAPATSLCICGLPYQHREVCQPEPAPAAGEQRDPNGQPLRCVICGEYKRVHPLAYGGKVHFFEPQDPRCARAHPHYEPCCPELAAPAEPPPAPGTKATHLMAYTEEYCTVCKRPSCECEPQPGPLARCKRCGADRDAGRPGEQCRVKGCDFSAPQPGPAEGARYDIRPCLDEDGDTDGSWLVMRDPRIGVVSMAAESLEQVVERWRQIIKNSRQRRSEQARDLMNDWIAVTEDEAEQLLAAAQDAARVGEENEALRNNMPPHEHEQISEELRRQIKRLELDLADAHREYNRQSRQTSESARRLERERDEARQQMDRWRGTADQLMVDSMAESSRLERERDEAREECERLRMISTAAEHEVAQLELPSISVGQACGVLIEEALPTIRSVRAHWAIWHGETYDVMVRKSDGPTVEEAIRKLREELRDTQAALESARAQIEAVTVDRRAIIDAAEGENAALRAALEPFGAAATRIENYHGPVFGNPAPASDFGSELDELTMGDFRAARAALAAKGERS
jgi:hypothetical protein